MDFAGRPLGIAFLVLGFQSIYHSACIGAESLAEAQKGLAFAAALKLLIPIIVVIPGIAALYLAREGQLIWSGWLLAGLTYGILMGLVPEGHAAWYLLH